MNQKVVYFWVSAPNMHCANVAASSEPADHSERMWGSNQIGPWLDSWKSHGAVSSPLSAGFSIMKSAPARLAADRSEAVRRVISLARCSSRRCPVGTSSTPSMCPRSRTTGGPSLSGVVKNRATEYVEQGGAVNTTA